MRLMITQFDYLPDGEGIKVCQRARALARIVPDTKYRGMWRAVRPDGSLTAMVNKARAKDIAYGMAETATYPHLAAE
jgi:hypothetical protein